MKREDEGLRWKMKGSRAKDQNKKVNGEKKGADSAKGENQVREGEKKKCKGRRWRISM